MNAQQFTQKSLEALRCAQNMAEENRNSELLDMFSICLVTAKGKENGDKIKELSKALNSDLVEEFITEKYHGAVVDYR